MKRLLGILRRTPDFIVIMVVIFVIGALLVLLTEWSVHARAAQLRAECHASGRIWEDNVSESRSTCRDR